MLIGATDDIVCPVSEMHSLHEKANSPKELFIIEGAVVDKGAVLAKLNTDFVHKRKRGLTSGKYKDI